MTVEQTGDTATIAGMSTRRFRVLADGKPYEDLWLASDPALARELNLERAPDTTFVGTLERRDFPESEFRPPAGFRKAAFNELFDAN